MNSTDSPLKRALTWWAEQDDKGGFQAVAATLFPGWTAKRSCRAPHREDKNRSFSVYRMQSGEWRFKDFGSGDAGTLVGFVMLGGMDERSASHWLMEKAGKRGAQQPVHVSRRLKANTIARHVGELAPMPGEVMATWSEGVDYLAANAEAVEELARFRGWPLAWARYLVDCAAVSMPLYHGRRTIAFLVEKPEGNAAGLTMRDVGFHCRLEPRPGEDRASWCYMPNDKEHRQSIPALPYIMGGSSFDSARLLVITGGQWDALTFAFASGWWGDGSCWPEKVCVVGMRGDSSSNTFLQAYERWWPSGANCLLLPDGDASGGKWFEGADSFASRLAVRCRKVAVVSCAPHKDFNDLYRAVQITPEQIAELLGSHGMAVQSGVTT